MMGKWYSRFLQLRRVVLLYEFDEMGQRVPRQAMEVGGVRSVAALEGKHAFEVTTPCGGRKWLCRVPSAEDRDTWTAALDMAVAEEEGAADSSYAASTGCESGAAAGGGPPVPPGADPTGPFGSSKPTLRGDAARARIESLLRERIALRQAVSEGKKEADRARHEAAQVRSELAAAQRELSSQKVTTMRALREQKARESELRQLEQERCVPPAPGPTPAARRYAPPTPAPGRSVTRCRKAEARVNDAFGSFAAGGVARLKALAREEQERAAAIARRLADAEREFEDILEFKVRRGGAGRGRAGLGSCCPADAAFSLALRHLPRARTSTTATCVRRSTVYAPNWRAPRARARGSCNAGRPKRIRFVCSWRRQSRKYWLFGARWRRWRRRRPRVAVGSSRPAAGTPRATPPAIAAAIDGGPLPSPPEMRRPAPCPPRR